MTTKEQEINEMCKKFAIDRLEFSTDEEEDEYFKASLERLYEKGYDTATKRVKSIIMGATPWDNPEEIESLLQLIENPEILEYL